MSRPPRWLPLLLVPLAVSGPLRGAQEARPATVSPSPLEPALAEVGLATIRGEPSLFVGQRVRFVVQFRGLRESWNPYLSRFGPRAWISFEGWEDERFTWDAQVYADPIGRMFARRGSRVANLLAEARVHHRLEIDAIVREVFLGEPWVEVLDVRPLVEQVGEGTILHVGRARELAGHGQFELAVEQFERAMAAPIPAHARLEIQRMIERSFEAREKAALEHERRR